MDMHGCFVNQHAQCAGKTRRAAVVTRSTGVAAGGSQAHQKQKPFKPRSKPNFKEVEWRGPGRLKEYKNSDGVQHLGSALMPATARPFPGPPPDEGPPLRVLPIGGLGEIGMNCMLVGVRDRYIVIDAGLMFPDFTDLGMQKILPDTSFLYEWRDKIEALVITHGHEDHIGALPWVVPALDPATPIYATSFVMQLVKRRLSEYSLFDEARFRTFKMREPFQAGPFQVEGIRVTHSIPDSCGLVLRSDEGTIVHTGDWKIDETPVDGQNFDRETFDMLSKERVALFMSDSTNALAPGRTSSEKIVHDSIVQKVLAHQNKGRVIVTQFASNLARLYGVKAAADASGRKICFVGASLNHYLEAAWQDGRAPFDPKELIPSERLKEYNPNEVIIVSTGSQGEPMAQLSKASREMSKELKILDSDLVLYSAKVIPGNEPQVAKMMNRLSMLGARVVQGRGDNLHTSGHAYQEELKEVMQLVKPQHFLPVHGEYAFLCEHGRLAKEQAGVRNVSVIKNGQMLGVTELPTRNHVSSGSMAKSGMSVIGRADLVNYYNDGGKGTGNKQEMAIAERNTLALEGVVVVAVDVKRDRGSRILSGTVRITTRAMWTDQGRLRQELFEGVSDLIAQLPVTAPLSAVERAVVDGVKRLAFAFNAKKPEVICICHEYDPRLSHLSRVAERRQQQAAAQSGNGAPGPASTRRPTPPGPPGGGRQPGFAGWGGAVSDEEAAEQSEGGARSRYAQQRPLAAGGSQQANGQGQLLLDDHDLAPAVTRLGSDEEERPEEVQGAGSPPAPEPAQPAQTATEAMLEKRRKARAAKSATATKDAKPQPEEPVGDTAAATSAPKKRGRPKSKAPPDTVPAPPGLELQVVPEQVMKARRAKNPRDHPTKGADPDSLAYD